LNELSDDGFDGKPRHVATLSLTNIVC
jgi:hypothetical protein